MLGIGQRFPSLSLTGVVSHETATAFTPIDQSTYARIDPAGGVAQRAAYVVDPEGIIRFVYGTDMNVGRSPVEVLRVLDGLQTDARCPCHWTKGDDTLQVA